MSESLYFITGEVSFAYVDFEPFLLAVEYALQDITVIVECHTDDRGQKKHNLQLPMKRVRQYKKADAQNRRVPERVSAIGYSKSEPKYDNSTEEGWQKNRRMDFKIFCV